MALLVLCLALFVSLSGCIQEKPGANLAPAPHLDLEATVVSLSLSDVQENPALRPTDTGVIRIDKINSISTDFDWVSAGIKEGAEVNVQFSHSARPAKIRTLPDFEQPTSNLPNTLVTGEPESFSIEDGYFVYAQKQPQITKETEKILPGLEVGSKFKATGWYIINSINISEYEITS